jgi:hypothetical protein
LQGHPRARLERGRRHIAGSIRYVHLSQSIISVSLRHVDTIDSTHPPTHRFLVFVRRWTALVSVVYTENEIAVFPHHRQQPRVSVSPGTKRSSYLRGRVRPAARGAACHQHAAVRTRTAAHSGAAAVAGGGGGSAAAAAQTGPADGTAARAHSRSRAALTAWAARRRWRWRPRAAAATPSCREREEREGTLSPWFPWSFPFHWRTCLRPSLHTKKTPQKALPFPQLGDSKLVWHHMRQGHPNQNPF